MTEIETEDDQETERNGGGAGALTRAQATELAGSLCASGYGLHLRSEVDEEWISFVGGRRGSHAVAIFVSSRARVLAHWRGYCEDNGLGAVPAPDDTVRFPSRSSGSGSRVGKVLRVTPTRCLIGYRFDYQRGEGPLREAWHPLVRVEVIRRGNAGTTRARGAGETSRGIASVAHESES